MWLKYTYDQQPCTFAIGLLGIKHKGTNLYFAEWWNNKWYKIRTVPVYIYIKFEEQEGKGNHFTIKGYN